MKRITIVTLWFTCVAICLFGSLAVFNLLNQNRNLNPFTGNNSAFSRHQNTVIAYAALPTSVSAIETNVTTSDSRPVIIEAYFSAYDSPLKGYGDLIVKMADKHGLDPFLLVAIAQQESNLCKIIPDDSYNCWGWGIHSEGTLRFESYDQAIQAVARGLKSEYIDKDYTTPEEIMSKYTPMSNGSWARGVNQFMAEMQTANF